MTKNFAHEHDAAALASLRQLGPAVANWVPPTEGVDYDVVVVGGGQCGLATAFALRQAGITSCLLVDEMSLSTPGIWFTKARMRTLRTPKEIPGPEIHNPALGFRAWFEARHGVDAFDAMDRIPRALWGEYMLWFRRIADVPVRAETRVVDIDPLGVCGQASGTLGTGHVHFRLTLQDAAGGVSFVTARRLVLATGYAGGGSAHMPAVAAHLPAQAFSHTDDSIDFAALAGKRVAVVGSASSAFDNAAAALEAGARSVEMLCRHADLNRIPTGRGVMYPGAEENFYHLPDAMRWEIAALIKTRGLHPVAKVVERATVHPNFHIHFDAPADGAVWRDGFIALNVPAGERRYDHIIFGTGYRIDPLLRPELRQLAPAIQVWADRPGLPVVRGADSLGRYPYLGAHYEYLPRMGGSESFLRHIYAPNLSALVSFARHVGEIGSLRSAVPRLVRGISRSLFLEDANVHGMRMRVPGPEELSHDLYEKSVALSAVAIGDMATQC